MLNPLSNIMPLEIISLALVVHYIQLLFLSNLVAEELNVGRPETEKCKVKNMSCVAFPTKKQCSGIGLGGCVSKFNYFSLQVRRRSISKNNKNCLSQIHYGASTL